MCSTSNPLQQHTMVADVRLHGTQRDLLTVLAAAVAGELRTDGALQGSRMILPCNSTQLCNTYLTAKRCCGCTGQQQLP
jgi:hypothetical protein